MAFANSPTLSRVTIDGIDVTNFLIEYSVVRESNEAISGASISFNRRLSSVLVIDNSLTNKSIVIQRGKNTATEQTIFQGFLTKINRGVAAFNFNARDKYYEALIREETKSFDVNIDPEGGVGSEIAKSLIGDNTNLNFDSSSVVSTGDILTIEKFVCNHNQVFERVDDIARAYNYQHYYAPDEDKWYFEPRGNQISGISLTVGTEIVNNPVWTVDSEKMINTLTIIGATQEFQDTYFANGDNTEGQQFVLPKTPKSVKIYVGTGSFDPSGTGTKPSDNNSNLKIGGRKGSTGGSFAYIYDDNSEVKTVYFQNNASLGRQPSFIPPVGTNNIEIQYTYEQPAPVLGKDSTSRETYGIHEGSIKKDDIKNVEDAQIYLKQYLEKYKNPFESTIINVVGILNIFPGRLYQIIDQANGKNDQYVATTVKMFYPYRPDEVSIASTNYVMDSWDTKIEDRVKRLEENETQTADLLVQIFASSADAVFENRYQAKYKKDRSDDGVNTFILGNGKFGVLGTQELGDAGTEFILKSIVPGSGIFKEFVYDTMFIDINETTANVSTTENTIVFSDFSSILVTKEIVKGFQGFTQAKVTFNEFALNEGVQLSYDTGAGWVEMLVDTFVEIPNISNGIRFKFDTIGGEGLPLSFPITLPNSTLAQIDENQYTNTTISAVNEDILPVLAREWSNVENIFLSDDSFASVDVGGFSSRTSVDLIANNLGFDISASENIKGIEITVKGYKSNSSNAGNITLSLYAGGITSENVISTTSVTQEFTDVNTEYTFGSSTTNPFSVDLTSTLVNDEFFGVGIFPAATGISTNNIFIDYVSVTIHTNASSVVNTIKTQKEISGRFREPAYKITFI